MRSASPLAPKECRSLPRHQGAPAKISGYLCRSLKLPEGRKQRPRRHLRHPASAAADINSSSSSSLDDLNPGPLDRARFPLLASRRSPVSHFVNLTNGLEAVPTLLALGVRDFTLVRLTSTACEQRRHADFLREADASLLAALAAGRVALVWDTSSRERGRGRSGGGDGDDSEEAGGRGEGAGGDDREWREALLSDEGGEEEEGSSSFLPRSRAGGGLRVPRALFWGLEFLRYACETRWSGGEGAFEAAATAEASGADDGGQHGGEGTASTFSSSLSPPPPPPPRAFLGEAGHDVTLDFERALRREVPDGAKARVRYFRRFYLSRRRQQQQQQQEQQERQQERQQEQQPRARGNGGGGGGSSSGDEGEARIRLWGCYRPSRLDRGGGDEAARRAQEELFDLAFSSSGAASGAASGDRVGGGGEEEDDKTCLSLPPPPPPPPPFSREALALELADLGWGLVTGGEDRAERLRASRRRRERAKRDG